MVRRRRRSDGAQFWGCPRFPACRGTRGLEGIGAVERTLTGDPARVGREPRDDPVWQEPASAAGRSAQAEGARRRARQRASVVERLPSILARGVMLAFVGLILTALGSTWVLAGWALIAVAVVSTLTELFAIPAHIRAWTIGAEGEVRTAKALAPLEREGYRVLHDRRLPGSRANIDHLVIGPSGVFVVETKSYAGRLRIRGRDLYIGGRRKTEFADQVNHAADVVSDVLDVDVEPILCVHRADFPLFGRLEVDGLPIVGPRGLVRRIRQRPTKLDANAVQRLADAAVRRLHPAD